MRVSIQVQLVFLEAAMRRKPRQQRSRQMVERLLDATARTLAERGLDNTTTNHIAENAGVSVGSLYQYFPDKEALVEALLERVIQDVPKQLNRQLGALDPASLDVRSVARLAIRIGLEFLRSDPLYLELARNWDRLPMLRPLDQMEEYFLTAARLYFLQHFREYPVRDLQARLYVLINSTMFTLVRWLSQDSPMLREEDVVEVLVDMIGRTLEGKAAAPA